MSKHENYPCPNCHKQKTFVVVHPDFGDCLRCAICRETFVPLAWDGSQQSFVALSDLQKSADDIMRQIGEFIERLEAEENDNPGHYNN